MDRKQHPMVIRTWNAGRPHPPAGALHPGKSKSTQGRRAQAAKRSKT